MVFHSKDAYHDNKCSNIAVITIKAILSIQIHKNKQARVKFSKFCDGIQNSLVNFENFKGKNNRDIFLFRNYRLSKP